MSDHEGDDIRGLFGGQGGGDDGSHLGSEAGGAIGGEDAGGVGVGDVDIEEKKQNVVYHAMSFPRLPQFSGEAKDANFAIWKYEVQCLINEKRSDTEIKTAIRRSLRGRASRTLLTLGEDASSADILNKFKSVFGSTQTAQTVLSTFYTLRQKDGEDAGTFAGRLEDVITQAVDLGRVKRGQVDKMLCEAFEEGLRSSVRAATSYLFGLNHPFDTLQMEVKRKERQLGLTTEKADDKEKVEKLTATVQQLTAEVKALRPQPTPQGDSRPKVGPGSTPNQILSGSERQRDWNARPDPNLISGSGFQRRNWNASRSGEGTGPQMGAAPFNRTRARGQQAPKLCWGCNSPTHYIAACPLNYQGPVGRGHPQGRY